MSKTEMKDRLNMMIMSKLEAMLNNLTISQLDEIKKDHNAICNHIACKDFTIMIESVAQEINTEWASSMADRTWKSFVNQIAQQVSNAAQKIRLDKILGL